jgi:hypothetical protein
MTKDGEGLITCCIDNLVGSFLGLFLRNCSFYNTQIKYAFIDGKSYGWDYVEKSRLEDCQVTLKKGDRADEIPTALGLEFGHDEGGHFQWLLIIEKVDLSRQKEERWRASRRMRKMEEEPNGDLDSESYLSAILRTPREFAQVVGGSCTKRQLDIIMRTDSKLLISILSKAGKFQFTNGGWDDAQFRSRVNDAEWDSLEAAYLEFKQNKWFSGGDLETVRPIVVAAADASSGSNKVGGGWGWVILGKIKATFPNRAPDKKNTAKDRGVFWDGQMYDPTDARHIYVKEVDAAVRVIKSICADPTMQRVEIVLTCDNTAAKCSLNRALSTNTVAQQLIDEAWEAVKEAGNTLTVVGMPGHYMVADFPSRQEPIPNGELDMPYKSGKKNPGLLTRFDPWVMTWEVVRKEYFGQRLDLTRQEKEVELEEAEERERNLEEWGFDVNAAEETVEVEEEGEAISENEAEPPTNRRRCN